MDRRSPRLAGGFLDALRQLSAELLRTVHDRLQLLGVELQEQKHRLLQILLLAAVGSMCAMLAVLFLGFALVWVVPVEHRAAVLAGLGVLFLGLLGFCVARLLAHLGASKGLLDSTLAELEADRACILQDEN